MNAKMSFILSLFKNKKDVRPHEVRRTWDEMCAWLEKPIVRKEKDGQLVSPAAFRPAYRLQKNVTELSLLVLDYDDNASLDVDLRAWREVGCCFAAHSTHSHRRATQSNPEAEERFRVVIPLAVSIPAEEFPALWRWAARVSGGKIDVQAQDASRMYYMPAIAAPDAPYRFVVEDGDPLDWRNLNLRDDANESPAENGSGKAPTFDYHEDRHAELCRRIMARGQLNSRGNYDAQCSAHNGKGKTALAYFPDSGAVKCNAGCSYDELLEAEGLPGGHLPSTGKAQSQISNTEDGAADAPAWPELHPAALYGLAGAFVRLVSPHSEADPVALLVQFLCAFGNLIGRCAHFLAEADKHFTNIFVVLVGATGAGRKGTSWGQVKLAFDGLDDVWQRDCQAGGMSSGEGLLYHVRDATTKHKPIKAGGEPTGVNGVEVVDQGVEDKRLLVYEGEFASVIRAQGREGNTLSMVIRNLWDTGDARSMVKNSPIRTTGALVSIIGHITLEELRSCLNEVDSVNGYVNRFLWFCVKRSRFLPRGGRLGGEDFAPLKRGLRHALDSARGVSEMGFDDAAWELWDVAYFRLETGRTGLLGKVTQRAAPYVRRLACLYALLDRSDIVRLEHLMAALALWQYAEDSARYIFGGRTGDRIADDILHALRQAGGGGLTLTDINDLFSRNRGKAAIENALRLLLESGLAWQQKGPAGERGRPPVRWFAAPQTYERNERNQTYTDLFVSFVPPASEDSGTPDGSDTTEAGEREVFVV